MAVLEARKELYKTLNAMAPEALFQWALEEHGDRAAIITSFQDTGCVMIDMMRRVAPGMRVVTVDTLRLHPETYELIDQIEARYDLKVERFFPDEKKRQEMIARHGEYLFFDSKAKQEYCCHVRKTEPNQRALETVDVWFTGLRRDQSAYRSDTPKVSLVDRRGRKILKVSPLAEWDEAQMKAYIEQYDVPMNPLYDQGYTSIGCIICSTPTLPHEDKRDGRWRWFNALDDDKKECGIHINGSGI